MVWASSVLWAASSVPELRREAYPRQTTPGNSTAVSEMETSCLLSFCISKVKQQMLPQNLSVLQKRLIDCSTIFESCEQTCLRLRIGCKMHISVWPTFYGGVIFECFVILSFFNNFMIFIAWNSCNTAFKFTHAEIFFFFNVTISITCIFKRTMCLQIHLMIVQRHRRMTFLTDSSNDCTKA